jgi:hypothetical protein
MAGVIGTGAHPKALLPGVNAWVKAVYEDFTEEFSQVFEVKSSSMAYEEDVETSGFDLAQVKTEGGAVAYTSHQQGATKRYTHLTYALGYQVSQEEIEDNQYKDKAFKRGGHLARSFRTTKEIVHWNVFNRATSGSYLGMDGKSLLATDHTSYVGSQSNKLATAADFAEAPLEDILTMIRLAKNSKGFPVQLKAKKLIVHANDEYNAARIIKSSLQSGTANNDINAVKTLGKLSDGAMVGTYLTDTDAWFVTTNAPDGLKSFQRIGYAFTTDNDFDTTNAKFKGRERYSCGWSDFLGVFGSEGV